MFTSKYFKTVSRKEQRRRKGQHYISVHLSSVQVLEYRFPGKLFSAECLYRWVEVNFKKETHAYDLPELLVDYINGDLENPIP